MLVAMVSCGKRCPGMKRHHFVTHVARAGRAHLLLSNNSFSHVQPERDPILTIKKSIALRPHASIIPESLPIRACRGRFFGRFNLRVTTSVAGRS
jgi:hypothetical protein